MNVDEKAIEKFLHNLQVLGTRNFAYAYDLITTLLEDWRRLKAFSEEVISSRTKECHKLEMEIAELKNENFNLREALLMERLVNNTLTKPKDL